MTNNSMKSRQSYLGKFQRLGVPAQLDEIYCSSYSAAAYLDSINFNSSKKAYVVGEHGIMDELAAVGISSFGGPDDNDKRCSFSQEIQQDPQVCRALNAAGLDACWCQDASLHLLDPVTITSMAASDKKCSKTPPWVSLTLAEFCHLLHLVGPHISAML
eukprot:GHRR01032777.1.p1 GENE.GHRR01032777.1~~GHRR01032777.1.p1  ORF type:complete len:159 (+),score=46.12 GHRR01032777.1:305-781(+)